MVRCKEKGMYDVTSMSDKWKDVLITLDVQDASYTNNADETSASATADLEPWTPVYPAYLKDLTSVEPTPTCHCDVIFDDKCGRNDAFQCVNDIPFNEDEYTHSIGFGSVVKRLTNANRKHPYHQHVYPYQFIGYKNEEHASGISKEVKEYFKAGDWHDVIMMDGLDEDEGLIELRFRPQDHLGLVMLHCHQLTHEDRGMMAWEKVLNVTEDNGEFGCVCDANTI